MTRHMRRVDTGKLVLKVGGWKEVESSRELSWRCSPNIDCLIGHTMGLKWTAPVEHRDQHGDFLLYNKDNRILRVVNSDQTDAISMEQYVYCVRRRRTK